MVTRLLVEGDGLTHAAEIRTSTGQTNRPIAKLYPLEVHSDEYTNKVPPAPTSVAENSVQQLETVNRID